MRNITIDGAEGYKINLYVFETEKSPVKGSILLLHGMAEHIERYADFINTLNARGFDVYTYHHRGHGPEVAKENLGFFAKKNGAELVIEDAVCAIKWVSENKRSEKYGLFGHSMGSLIGRNVLQRFDQMDCALICGTGFAPEAMCRSGLAVCNIVQAFGPAKKSPLLNNLMFGTKEYKRDCKRTEYDWLTKDEAIVDKYIADDLCGFLCSASFYRDLTKITLNARIGLAKTRHDLPIFIASGDCDPVGGFGVGIRELYETYKKEGFTDVSMKLYENDRHELLNELDKEQVTEDFVSFFEKHM